MRSRIRGFIVVAAYALAVGGCALTADSPLGHGYKVKVAVLEAYVPK